MTATACSATSTIARALFRLIAARSSGASAFAVSTACGGGHDNVCR